MSNYRYLFSLPKLLLTLAALALFIMLGFWQLSRAQEKETMLQLADLSSKQAAIPFSPTATPSQYQQLKISGHYLAHVLFLDNQYYNHQIGYEVLSALELTSKAVILVDRGWVAGDSTRKTLPQVEIPSENLTLSGQVYYPSKKTWVLGPEIEKISSKLAVIEKINPELLSQFLHKSVYPFIIRLNKNEDYGFIRDWKITTLSPAKHKGYAFQWFTIAVAILVIYLGLSIKRINEDDKA